MGNYQTGCIDYYTNIHYFEERLMVYDISLILFYDNHQYSTARLMKPFRAATSYLS